MKQLVFKTVVDHPELVAPSVFNFVKNWQGQSDPKSIEVTEIDPTLCGGEDLCRTYGVDPLSGANCLIIEAKRGNEKNYCACLAPVGFKMDLGSIVRRHVSARIVSMAPLDFVLSETQMEHGSVTPVGLPSSWKILLDSSLLKNTTIMVGSGIKKSKLRLPISAIMELPNISVLEGLGKKRNMD